MADQRPLSGRKVIVASAISLSAGIIGTLVGKIFGTALQTTPAWVGPAIFIGSIALLLVGALCCLPQFVKLRLQIMGQRPNNSFKPTPLRSGVRHGRKSLPCLPPALRYAA